MGVEIKYWKVKDQEILWVYWAWTDKDRNKEDGKLCVVNDRYINPIDNGCYVVAMFTRGYRCSNVSELRTSEDIPSSLRYNTTSGYYFDNAYKTFMSRMDKTNIVNGETQQEKIPSKDYPHKCPICDKPAYINLFGSIDCSNCEGK